MRRPGNRQSIPLGDAAQLAAALRRTRIVRLVLAGALVVVVAATLVASRSADEGSGRLLPRGASGVIVLDVSASISSTVYRQVGEVLNEAAASGGTFGLALFSDTAYEALPPGTPAAELRGFGRFFTPLRGSRSVKVRGGTLHLGAYAFPANPWSGGFTAGTRISSGLELARAMLNRDHVGKPAVVLISDLATDQTDIAPLADTLVSYKREGIPIRVVGLSPAPNDERFFRNLLGAEAMKRAPIPRPGALPPARSTAGGATFPAFLVGGAVLLLVLLAANELWCGRLTWGRPRATGSAA